MTIAVLLGAGASVEAGIPATLDMTDAVLSRLDDPDQQRIAQFVRYTIAASLALQEARNPRVAAGRPQGEVDVERLFASIEHLVDRDDQAWSPFVASWHHGLEAFVGGGGAFDSDFFRMSDLERGLNRMGSQYRGTREAAEAISKFVGASIPRVRGDVSGVLAGVRDEMLQSLFTILDIRDKSRVAYLNPLVDLARKQGALTVATLNYDRSVENAAELVGEPCDTLIQRWLEAGSLAPPRRGLKLLKLHGSIDWVFEDEVGYLQNRELPLRRLRTVSPDEKQYYRAPAVVFGEAGKLRAEGPFLELLLAWANELQAADRLVVVGYSFRDSHVNEAIARWFNAHPERRIVVVDPSPLGSPDRTGLDFAEHMSYMADPRNPDGPTPPRVRHIAGGTGESLTSAIEEASREIVATS